MGLMSMPHPVPNVVRSEGMIYAISPNQWKERWTMYKERFGKNISKILDDKGWDDDVAANAFGVSRTMVVKYRGVINFPDAETLAKYADILGCSTDYLYGRSKSTEILDPVNGLKNYGKK